ncbi:MAG TPA: flavodoxin family protein [Thermoleophilia bacterium]|nr:flavodoxin family protein [Thermoleophilia bacterium]
MTVRILGLDCSPRDKSNSGIMLDTAFNRLGETYPGEVQTEIVQLRDLHLEPCKACSVCGKTKDTGKFIPCVRADEDDAQMVLDKMVDAHGILVATPVYFGLPSDLFSKFIMRTRPLRHQDFKLANKPVGVMAVAGRRSGGAETTIIATWLPFVRNGCLVVGNGDGTCQFGAYGWAGARGHVLTDEWGLVQAYQTSDRVFTLARLLQAGVEASGFVNPMTFSYSQGMRP